MQKVLFSQQNTVFLSQKNYCTRWQRAAVEVFLRQFREIGVRLKKKHYLCVVIGKLRLQVSG